MKTKQLHSDFSTHVACLYSLSLECLCLYEFRYFILNCYHIEFISVPLFQMIFMLLFVGDITFFKQYHLALQPICVALDVLQSERNAYMGILLPTIAMCLKKLMCVQENDSLRLSKPILDAVIAGIKKRFLANFKDFDLLLASAFHPQFKLCWFKWLDEIDIIQRVPDLREKVETKMVSLVDSQLDQSESDDSSSDFLSNFRPDQQMCEPDIKLYINF